MNNNLSETEILRAIQQEGSIKVLENSKAHNSANKLWIDGKIKFVGSANRYGNVYYIYGSLDHART